MKTIEKMTWMSPAMKDNPPVFPCMICRRQQGDYRVTLSNVDDRIVVVQGRYHQDYLCGICPCFKAPWLEIKAKGWGKAQAARRIVREHIRAEHPLSVMLLVCADCANRSEADLLDILTAKPKRR